MITRLDVIMPVYNERRTVERAARRILDCPSPRGIARRLLIVDDASTDGTADVLDALAGENSDIQLLRHDVNRGKGAALRTAFGASTADVVLVHDADLEYDPRDHECVLAPILDDEADAVVGSRFLGQSHRVLYYWHYLANKAISTLSNMCTNLNLTDIECCTKAMTRAVADRLVIEEDRFGVEPELVAKIARMRLEGGRPVRVYEVPVRYAGRTYAEGKKIGATDALRALWCIARYGLGPHARPRA